jgi:hypothetical protein
VAPGAYDRVGGHKTGEKIHRDEALVVVAGSETDRPGSLLVLEKSVAAVECR